MYDFWIIEGEFTWIFILFWTQIGWILKMEHWRGFILNAGGDKKLCSKLDDRNYLFKLTSYFSLVLFPEMIW